MIFITVVESVYCEVRTDYLYKAVFKRLHILWHFHSNVKYLTLRIYLLTSWSRVLLEKLTGFQMVKKFSKSYGTRTIITAFTSTRYISVSWVRSIQPVTLQPNSWIYILILFYNVRLGLPICLFPLRFSDKTLYMRLLFPLSVIYGVKIRAEGSSLSPRNERFHYFGDVKLKAKTQN